VNERRNRSLAALALAAALAAPCTGALAEGKIGFVNTERIMRDSVPAQRAQKKIEGEFQKRDQDLSRMADQLKRLQDDLEKNAMTMAESQRRAKERELTELDRDFQRKRREFQEDLNQRRNEELAQVLEQANRAIRLIAEQEKYDIIFQDAVYANPRIDLTDKVIKALEGKPPAR
jgi:outer membrane protein